MKTNWNNKTIIEEIKKNGYYIFPNYFSTKDLKKIKSSLLRILHYIKPDSEQDLQKKLNKTYENGFEGDIFKIFKDFGFVPSKAKIKISN